MHTSNLTRTCISRNAEHCPDGDQDRVCQHHADIHQDVEGCKIKEEGEDEGKLICGALPFLTY